MEIAKNQEPLISSFRVDKLHGEASYDIRYENNTLVLVAENGSGKTTLVNMMYYFLTRQWVKLNEYKFEKITATVKGRELSFNKSKYNQLVRRDSKLYQRFPVRYRPLIEHLYSSNEGLDFINQKDYSLKEYYAKLSDMFNISTRGIQNILHHINELEIDFDNDESIQEVEEYLKNVFKGIQIIYLPTYRRIEKDLKNIFPDLDESMERYESKRRYKSLNQESPEYIELVEFGMQDVKDRITRRCDELKNFFYNNLGKKITGSYLEDILKRNYRDFDTTRIQDFNEDALNYILKRLDDSFLSSSGKKELKAFVEQVKENGALNVEDKINAYFVWKLFQIYQEQKNAELDINKFVDICNDYIKNKSKKFHFDSDNFEVSIRVPNSIKLSDNKFFNIDFKDLSSGEKQIVSLFSHIYLSKQDYFIIIDEPELSLSVPWQERFLPDINSSQKCTGIIAVTHSPFIFKNELKQYAHSLEEFSIKKNRKYELS
ncbi:AAA family ATPase [Pontibacter sp. CAU 1760]